MHVPVVACILILQCRFCSFFYFRRRKKKTRVTLYVHTQLCCSEDVYPGRRYFEYQVSCFDAQARSHLLICIVDFDSYAEIKSISIPHRKSKSLPARTQNPSQFRPSIKKTSQFRPPTQTGGSIPTLRATSFPTEYKNQVNFDHLHKNQVLFDRPHENEVISGPHTKTKSISTIAQKPSQSLIPPTKIK